jgi:membrane protease YdiL (CAAX protease family)
MVGHLRVKSPWSQLGIFLGLFGAAFLLTSLFMAVVVLYMGVPADGIDKLDLTKPEYLNTMKTMQAVSSVFIFLAPALIYAFITFSRRPLFHLGLRPAERKQTYALAVVCILVAFPFVFWLGELNHMIPLPKWMNSMEADATKQMEAFLKADNTFDIVINVFIIAFLPAICEELCFRGALQRIMIHLARNAWLGIIATAILFSALHLQFQGFLPRMFLGVILGAIYWYSGSLWPSIVAHFVNNAVQVIAVSNAPEYIKKNPSVPLLAALISGLLVWAILWMFKTYSTASYRKVYEADELNESNQFLA